MKRFATWLLLAVLVMVAKPGWGQDAAPEPVDILFVGDSITDFWDNAGMPVFQEYFLDHYKVINIGVSGDITDSTLVRLDQPRVANIKPTMIMLMIGTNDIGWKKLPAEHAIAGNQLILDKLRKMWPEAKILHLAVFPRDKNPGTDQREKIATINAALSKMADGKNIFFKDINAIWLNADGTLKMEIMPDALHPNAAGYVEWAKAVMPTVKEWVGK